jgi:hypothetical protein
MSDNLQSIRVNSANKAIYYVFAGTDGESV